MIVEDLYIDNFDWHVRIFYAVTCYWTDRIIQELKDIQCPKDKLKRAYENMSSCQINTGITYSNNALRETIIVIGKWSDPSEFDNSFSHELRHFSDHIANAFGLMSGGEEIAYFTGEIRKKLFPVNKMFLCGCKSHNEDIQRELYKCNYKH